MSAACVLKSRFRYPLKSEWRLEADVRGGQRSEVLSGAVDLNVIRGDSLQNGLHMACKASLGWQVPCLLFSRPAHIDQRHIPHGRLMPSMSGNSGINEYP